MMSDAFTKLGEAELGSLIAALKSRRVVAPYPALQVSRVIPSALAAAARDGLSEWAALGCSAEQIAKVLELLVLDRTRERTTDPAMELVTSGPAASGITNRDTSVVVRELFQNATQSVLLVGYAVHQGQRIFETLARRMEDQPTLQVRFFLNIPRAYRDKTPAEILVSRFKQQFKNQQWPAGCRLPELYYDPRTVTDDAAGRSSLHAKCIVVDSADVFVSSANFTQAAHERNIEVGLAIRSAWLAGQITKHFRTLDEQGLMVRAF